MKCRCPTFFRKTCLQLLVRLDVRGHSLFLPLLTQTRPRLHESRLRRTTRLKTTQSAAKSAQCTKSVPALDASRHGHRDEEQVQQQQQQSSRAGKKSVAKCQILNDLGQVFCSYLRRHN
jgi:hypothetical protein